MKFAYKEPEDDNRTNDVVMWLSSIDVQSLREEVLSTYGWGEGDPVAMTIKLLIEKAQS